MKIVAILLFFLAGCIVNPNDLVGGVESGPRAVQIKVRDKNATYVSLFTKKFMAGYIQFYSDCDNGILPKAFWANSKNRKHKGIRLSIKGNLDEYTIWEGSFVGIGDMYGIFMSEDCKYAAISSKYPFIPNEIPSQGIPPDNMPVSESSLLHVGVNIMPWKEAIDRKFIYCQRKNGDILTDQDCKKYLPQIDWYFKSLTPDN